MINIETPYRDLKDGNWLRGNLHAHCNRSDGDLPVQEVIDAYAGLGYDFLMLSDHDVFTSKEDLARLDARGMVLIPGNEISSGGPHLLHVNADRRIEPRSRRQLVFNEIAAAKGFAVVNHPNWGNDFNHASIAQMQEWEGYHAVEIYNGVIGRLTGSQYATDKWDMVLSKGKKIWGCANDDFHRANEAGLGWNMVYTNDRSVEGIVAALERGCYYASTGVTIRGIRVEGRTITVETEDAETIVALGANSVRLAKVDSGVLELEVPDTPGYVRFECWGRGEKLAWTQPFFVEVA